ncbi:MAG: amino acid permease, partial [Betaproteobacteria bacterium]|nr:amino acid permease [Betaproteobacteria bacterium]
RIRDPQRAKPFKVPLYPLTPALFCLACAYLTYSSIGYAMSQNAIHVSVLLLFSGSVVLAFIHWREK